MVIDRITAARSDEFAGRVAMILMSLCVAVTTEAGSTANHANRLAFANLHFRAQVNTKSLAAAVIASNATIQATIDASPKLLGANVPDGDLEFVLVGLINSFANAYAAG